MKKPGENMVELHFMSLHHRQHADPVLDDSFDESTHVLAVGFCESCGGVVTESNVMRKEIEGNNILLCSESCETRISNGTTSVTEMYSYHW